MRVRLRLLAPILFLCALGVAWAANWVTASLVGNRFEERVRTEAPVAGGDIMGLIVGRADWQARGQRLFVRSPGTSMGTVCVEATSTDGSYVAFNSYRFPSQHSGTYVEIPVDAAQPVGTSHPERFAKATAQTMAFLAREGACEKRATTLLPLKWAAQELPDGGILQLTFAVQSGRTTVFLTVGNDPPTTCVSMTAERLTAFDTLCQVTIDRKRAGSLKLRIRRCAFDDCVDAPLEMLDL